MTQPLHDRRDEADDPRGPRWSVSKNARGVVVIQLEPHAIPSRTPEWEASMRAEIGDDAYRRQYGHDWSTPSGRVFYPEFAARVHQVSTLRYTGWYVRPWAMTLRDAPFVRGWDFGYHRPAMVLGQFDKASGILWIYRELRVEDMLAHEFCALGRYLCGQATLEDLKRERRHHALAWLERERREPFYGVETPWLEPGQRLIDYAAKHEKNGLSGLAASQEELTWAMVFRQQGVFIRGRPEGWDDRETIMRFLMRESGIPNTPRLLLDPACRYALGGLGGGLVQRTDSQRFRGPKRDKLYEDIHDAITYVAAGCWPLRVVHQILERERRAQQPAPLAPITRARRWNPMPGPIWSAVESRAS